MIRFVLAISAYDPRPTFHSAVTAGFYFDWAKNASAAETHLRRSVCDALLINCHCDRQVLEVCAKVRHRGIPVGCLDFNDCPNAHNPHLTPQQCIPLSEKLLFPKKRGARRQAAI